MNNNDLLDILGNLAQLDIDASYAYTQALKNIEDKEIYNNIKDFRTDHEKHIQDLNKIMQFYGGTEYKKQRDLKGFLIEGFTLLRSSTGTIGALKAMETNEKITNKIYKDTLDKNYFPTDVRVIIEKNYNDEKRHLRYIRTLLKTLDE